MHDGKLPAIPDRLERRQPRMESEEPVQVERALLPAVWPPDRNRRPRAVVVGFAMRHDHAETVHRAPLKDRDELLRAPSGARRKRGAREKRRCKTKADEC